MKYILYFSAILLSFSSCVQPGCDFNGGYLFERPATLSPAQSTYHIGDTITISSTFSDNVYERETERTYLLENFNFYPGTGFCRLDTVGIDTIEMVTTDHFDFIIGPEYDYRLFISSFDGAVLEGQFNYENEFYDLEYKLVVKKPGLYLTQFGTFLDQFGQKQDFPGKCNGQGVNSWTVINEGSDNNAEFLLEAVDSAWHRLYNDRLDNDFHKLGGYCFKVEK